MTFVKNVAYSRVFIMKYEGHQRLPSPT